MSHPFRDPPPIFNAEAALALSKEGRAKQLEAAKAWAIRNLPKALDRIRKWAEFGEESATFERKYFEDYFPGDVPNSESMGFLCTHLRVLNFTVTREFTYGDYWEVSWSPPKPVTEYPKKK